MKVCTVVLMVGCLGSAGWTAETSACRRTDYQVSVTNVSRQGIGGVVRGQTTAGFYVRAGETIRIRLAASSDRREYRNEVFLLEDEGGFTRDPEGQCREYVLLPEDCGTPTPAARLYVYQSHGQSQCFMRSAIRPTKAGAERLALKP